MSKPLTNEQLEAWISQMKPRALDPEYLSDVVSAVQWTAQPDMVKFFKKLSDYQPKSLSVGFMEECSVLLEQSELESWGRSIKPQLLSELYLQNLEEKVLIAETEAILLKARPLALSTEFFRNTLERIENAGNPRVIEFPSRKKFKWTSMLSAAAAVAFMGGAIGLISSPQKDRGTLTQGLGPESMIQQIQPVRWDRFTENAQGRFTPVSHSTQLRGMSHHEVVLDDQNLAHRVVDFNSVEHLVLLDENGRERTFEKPKRKVRVVVPASAQ